MPTLSQIYGKKVSKKFELTTFMGQEIDQSMHPTRIVNDILSLNKATQFSSVMEVGWAGSGKTTMAEMFCHMIHTRDENWIVHWAGANELREIENFFNSLKKSAKHIIVFDDVSNALKSVSAQRRAKIFEVLTQGRHITNYSRIITLSIIHYTNSMEKSVRAQNMYYIYTATSLAEETNINKLLEADPKAMRSYKRFKKAFSTQMKKGNFKVNLPKGKIFERDQPFRIALAIDFDTAYCFLSTKMSCAKCARKRSRRFLPPDEIIKQIKEYKPKAGLQALAYYLATHWNLNEALPSNVKIALKFIERLFSEHDTKREELMDALKRERQISSSRAYVHHKKEDEAYNKLIATEYTTDKTDETMIPIPVPVTNGLNTLFNN